MAITIKPLEDRIVIRQVDSEEKTASGLYIPDAAPAALTTTATASPWTSRWATT